MGQRPVRGPPLELMHSAAAGNTVVGDKYGLFNMFVFVFYFVRRGYLGKVVLCGPVFPMLNPSVTVNMEAGRSLFFRPRCCPVCPFCFCSSGLLGSAGPSD